MNNNDRLLRLRYAIDIRDMDLIKAFDLSGIIVARDGLREILTKKSSPLNERNAYLRPISNQELDAFLNGFIILKRGQKENKLAIMDQPKSKEIKYINNVLLKKLKIALYLTSDDMLAIFAESKVYPSKGELGAILRKEGHRNFKPCGDKYARSFLKGLGLVYRREENRQKQ